MKDFPIICRTVGSPADPGKATLRIRTRRDEDGWIVTQAFAVLADGTEVEIEDVAAASWQTAREGDPPELTTGTITAYGVELVADVQGVKSATFGAGERVLDGKRETTITDEETAT